MMMQGNEGISGDSGTVLDFSDLTFTDLMIRIVMLLGKIPREGVLEWIVRRDQRDSIERPFSRKGYQIGVDPVGTNHYHMKLKKSP